MNQQIKNYNIHDVVQKGDLQEVERLLQNGTHPNALNCERRTPLHLAVEQGNADMVRLLKRYHANLDVSNGWQRPLITAINGNFVEITKILLGVELDQKMHEGPSANPNMQPGDKGSPLFLAIKSGNMSIVQLLIEAGVIIETCWSEQGYNALFCAVLKGNIEIVKILLEAHMDVNIRNANGETVLHIAARKGYNTIVQLLLNASADITIKNNEHETALHYAVIANNSDIVKCLLQAGIDPNSANIRGMSPLHLVVNSNYYPLIQLLLDYRVDVNYPDNEGNTPLHWVAIYGNAYYKDSIEFKIVQLLLHNGAKKNLPNVNGDTVVDIYQRRYQQKNLQIPTSVSFVYDFVQPSTVKRCKSVKH